MHPQMINMIIPVVDIKDNECVSGKSGNRDSYKKLDSVFGDNPLEIANNLKKAGYSLLYVADLDRLEHAGDNSELISKINEVIPVMLDNAIKNIDDVEENDNITTYNILATESMSNLSDIHQIIKEYPNDKLVVSIDIKEDKLLTDNEEITLDDIIDLINSSNISQVIILNITHVGTKVSDKSPIEEHIIKNVHDAEFIIAGGITAESIDAYQKENINNFLVGTVLHEGKLKKW